MCEDPSDMKNVSCYIIKTKCNNLKRKVFYKTAIRRMMAAQHLLEDKNWSV